jgi:hypothetical protein
MAMTDADESRWKQSATRENTADGVAAGAVWDMRPGELRGV